MNNKTNSKIDKEPLFVKIYLQDVLYLQDIPRAHLNALFKLLKYANKSRMEVVLNSTIKKRIMKNVHLQNMQTIDNALVNLTKGKILYRTDLGVYQINPYFFGFNNGKNINELRLKYNYDDIKGKTYKDNITD